MNNIGKQKSILFVAANPKETTTLRLLEEEREIKERLRIQGYGKVPIHSSSATRLRDIQQVMLDLRPEILHFSGHDLGEERLVFEDMNVGLCHQIRTVLTTFLATLRTVLRVYSAVVA